MSSGKNDKYKCLTGEEILPSNQSRTVEQANFIYYILRKNYKTNKNNIQALKILKPDVKQYTIKDKIPKGNLNQVAKNDIDRNKEIEKIVNREDL